MAALALLSLKLKMKLRHSTESCLQTPPSLTLRFRGPMAKTCTLVSCLGVMGALAPRISKARALFLVRVDMATWYILLSLLMLQRTVPLISGRRAKRGRHYRLSLLEEARSNLVWSWQCSRRTVTQSLVKRILVVVAEPRCGSRVVCRTLLRSMTTS